MFNKHRLMIVGEGPGAQESITGIPFSGASGIELDYLYLRRAAGLRREDVYTTNICKYRTDENDSDPSADDISRDTPELLAEIEVCNPQIIVAVGRVAAAWFSNIKDVDMEKLHGTPIQCPRYPDKVLLVVYHPAAALHQPERYSHLVYWDFEQLGRLVRGEIGLLKPAFVPEISSIMPRPVTHPVDLETDGFNKWAVRLRYPVAIDTEGSVENPWGMSYAMEQEKGYVVPHDSIDLTDLYLEGHNILHDAPVLRALGQRIDLSMCDDSMLLLYLLPWYPRGLKAASFKILGIEQREYEDVIGPANEKIAQEFIQKVLANKCQTCEGTGSERIPYKRQPEKTRLAKCSTCGGDGTAWPQPKAQLLFNGDGSARVYKPRSAGRRLREISERGTSLREGWANIDGEVRQHIEGQLGPLREATLDDVHYSDVEQYAGLDACLTKGLCNYLKPILKAEGLWDVYEIDKGILPIIDRMQTTGILIDRDWFSSLAIQFADEQSEYAAKLDDLAGRHVNPASWQDVGKLLYDKFKLKPLRGERSTDEKALETLKIRYRNRPEVGQAVDLITNHRELDKLKGTYLEPIPLVADSNSRVHTQFLLHVTNTGRPASRNPNLANIPVRTERGKLIRKGFIPKKGCKLVSVDLDQIELRVLAHLSQDENMIRIFAANEDIHIATAKLIGGSRDIAKKTNYLIGYGGSANRLYSELLVAGVETTKDQCVGYINAWFEAYPAVRDYMERCYAQARATNYVECVFGRRRYVPGVHSGIDKVREESLRWAVNTPIQATAAGINKLWLARIDRNVLPVVESKGYCAPLLTIYDEAILEVEEGLEDEVIQMVIREAEQCYEMLAPIRAKGSSAYNWAALKG